MLELVDGPTLAALIAQGPMTLDDALPIARQIADALEAAHEQGVIHRDLKPANIKVRPDGAVKVLDFGLAKAFASTDVRHSSGPTAVTNSPTLSVAMTGAGMILGTAAYMAPEQARGRVVDKRADVWAFGVVLYEMLTGKTLFTGETASDTLASVLKEQPDVNVLPSQVRRLLRSCLEKDPRKRLRDIGDVRLLLDEAPPRDDAPTKQPGRMRLLPWALAGVFFVAAAAVAFVHFRESPPAERSVRFQVTSPEKSTIGAFGLSPDGRYLAMIVSEAGRSRLWVRPLDSLDAQPLPGTDGADWPFWSPDSRFIGFNAQGKLKKIAVAGGPPQSLCDAPSTAHGAWSRDGIIVFAPGPGSPLQRVPADGGVPVPVTTPGPGENHVTPDFIASGPRFFYTVARGTKPESNGVFVGSLDGSPSVRLLPDQSNAVYVPPLTPAGHGHLVFRREGSLMAQPFDVERLRIVGEMFPLAGQVGAMSGSLTGVGGTQGAFSASVNGVVAFAAGNVARDVDIVWLDRTGKQLQSASPPGVYDDFRLAADERRIVFGRSESSNSDIWVLDMLRGVTSRLTSDPATDNLPIWSPDGLRVLFPSRRSGAFDLYIEPATGAAQEKLLIKMGTPNGWGTDWSQDGNLILYQRPGTKTGQDLWIAPQVSDRQPFPYLQSPFNEQHGVFSPDGRWIAYVSDESGRDEVYVQGFPLSSEKRQISTNGASDPNWRKDGTELFYLAADRNLMAVPVKARGTTFEPGGPKALFQVPGNLTRRSYAVGSTGQRFLVSRPLGETTGTPVTVVTNWQAAVRK